MKIKKSSLIFLLLIAVFWMNGSVVEATYSLPSNRSVVWQGNVGVNGDIPNRTTICATLNPSGGDDTNLIQNAINACSIGQVVKLNAGVYTISNSLTMKAGISLRGAGMGVTILKATSNMGGYFFLGISGASSWNLSNVSSFDIVSGLTKGSTTITTSVPHGWQVGDYIVIDQLNNNNPNAAIPVSSNGTNGTCFWCGRGDGARSLGQMAKIVAVPTATSVTLEIPLYWNYDSNLSPQGTKVTGVVANTGVEDLTIDNSANNNSSAQSDDGTIYMNENANSWLLRVEAIGSYKNMVRVYGGYRNTIRGCKFHEGVPPTPENGEQYDTSRGYGINISQWASANLIENNELYHLATIALVSDGPVSGNVVSYNYIHDGYNPVTWQDDGIAQHGAHPMMNLYEGNYIEGLTLGADNIWGTSSDNTYFRNRVTNTTNSHYDSRLWAVDMYQQIRDYNLVGNVIGSATDTIYELNNNNFNTQGSRAIYKLGYVSGGDSTAAGNDPQVKATLLRHENWDSVRNVTTLNDNVNTNFNSSDAVLPASIYLTSKPSWWGNGPWPAIGPDITPMFNSIPAMALQSHAASIVYKNSDYVTLVANWLKVGVGIASDVNSDGIVNHRDMAIMMSRW